MLYLLAQCLTHAKVRCQTLMDGVRHSKFMRHNTWMVSDTQNLCDTIHIAHIGGVSAYWRCQTPQNSDTPKLCDTLHIGCV